ncbi:MAG TPA: hypothetical protein VFR71_05130, partial [Methyloceanibacter sp.]|nr:hypothetical protein [Methyloceanibacter sp.]
MSLLVARLAAVIVATVGGLILFGWQIASPELLEAFPTLTSMTPAGAAGFIAAAIGLFCFTFRPIRPLARVIGFALVVLGLAVLTQDLLGFNLGIDQALVDGSSLAAGAARGGEVHMAS